MVMHSMSGKFTIQQTLNYTLGDLITTLANTAEEASLFDDLLTKFLSAWNIHANLKLKHQCDEITVPMLSMESPLQNVCLSTNKNTLGFNLYLLITHLCEKQNQLVDGLVTSEVDMLKVKERDIANDKLDPEKELTTPCLFNSL